MEYNAFTSPFPDLDIQENDNLEGMEDLGKDWTATRIRLDKIATRNNKPHYSHLNPLQKRFVKAKERYDLILLEMRKMEYRDKDWRKTEFGGRLLEEYLHTSNKYHNLLNKLDIDEVQGQDLYNSAHSSRYYGGSYGLEDKMLTKKIMDNFEQIKEFADKTFPVPVDTRLGLTTINIYNKKDKNLIGQIDLEEGIILEGQIDMYSGKVETDEFLPFTKRLRDFIMQPGQLTVKAQEQAQLFGIADEIGITNYHIGTGSYYLKEYSADDIIKLFEFYHQENFNEKEKITLFIAYTMKKETGKTLMMKPSMTELKKIMPRLISAKYIDANILRYTGALELSEDSKNIMEEIFEMNNLPLPSSREIPDEQTIYKIINEIIYDNGVSRIFVDKLYKIRINGNEYLIKNVWSNKHHDSFIHIGKYKPYTANKNNYIIEWWRYDSKKHLWRDHDELILINDLDKLEYIAKTREKRDWEYSETEKPYITEETGQSKLFGMGRLNPQTDKIERFHQALDRYKWIADKLSDTENKQIYNKLKKLCSLLDISSPCIILKDVKLIYGDDTIIKTPVENIPAKYAVIDIFDVVPSHDFRNYSKSKDYPPHCQVRDYSKDETEKRKIILIIKEFDPRFLVSDVISATDGPPIITNQGIAIGGNGRTIAMQIVANDEVTFEAKYKPMLLKKAESFGLNKADIEKFDVPALVRVIDIPYSKCSTYSRLLNEVFTQSSSEATSAISVAKILEEKHGALEKIANIFTRPDEKEIEDENGKLIKVSMTFREMINDKSVAEDLIGELKSAGIITTSNESHWVEDNKLTNAGIDELEFALMASIIPDKTLINEVSEYKQKIMKALPQFIKIKALPGKWNIVNNVQDAVKHEYHRRQTDIPNRQKYLAQTGMDEPVSELTALVWELLEWSRARELRLILDKYTQTARGTFESVFATEQDKTPEEILQFYFKKAKTAREENRELSDADLGDFQLGNENIQGLGDILPKTMEELLKKESEQKEPVSQIPAGNSQIPEPSKSQAAEVESPKPEADNSTSNIQNPTQPEPDPGLDLPALPNTEQALNAKVIGKPLQLNKTKYLFVNLLDNANILIYGQKGNGKTSFALDLADDLFANGPVLYMLAESPIDTRFQELLKRRNIASNIDYYEGRDFLMFMEYLKTGKYKSAIIDSINHIENFDMNNLSNLMTEYPGTKFIYIARMDKAGKKYLGPSDLEYLVDTVISIENGFAKLIKHRDYGDGNFSQRTMPIFQKKKVNIWQKASNN